MSDESEFSSSGALARRLGVPRWRLIHLIEAGIVPDASTRVPGRRLFSAADIERIQDALRKLPQGKIKTKASESFVGTFQTEENASEE